MAVVDRHAAWLCNRYSIGATGKTPIENLNATKYTGEVCVFGETVLYRISFPHHRRVRAGERLHKADSAWHKGIWWGKAEDTDEHIVGTPRGVVRCRCVRRLVLAEQADVRLLEVVVGIPWGHLASYLGAAGGGARDAATYCSGGGSAW